MFFFIQGVRGDDGPKGQKGDIGLPGLVGLMGKKGSDGKPGPRVSLRIMKKTDLYSYQFIFVKKLRVLMGKKVSQDVQDIEEKLGLSVIKEKRETKALKGNRYFIIKFFLVSSQKYFYFYIHSFQFVAANLS